MCVVGVCANLLLLNQRNIVRIEEGTEGTWGRLFRDNWVERRMIEENGGLQGGMGVMIFTVFPPFSFQVPDPHTLFVQP